MKSPKKLYNYHVSNLREIDCAIDKIEQSIRYEVPQNNGTSIQVFVKINTLLLGAWAETRLRKLLYEPQGFTVDQRTIITSEKTQFLQWKKAIEVAFRQQYKVPKAEFSLTTLAHTPYTRYVYLNEVLESDLKPVIEVRNKLAHGQWVYPLNSDQNDIAQPQMDSFRNENYLSLRFKKSLLATLSATIHDLIVSKPTFERDFDMHINQITQTQQNLKNRSYQKWEKQIRDKFLRGKSMRTK